MSLEYVREKVELEVLVEDYGFTGEGYVRLEDGWLSIPGAMPGERVRVELEEGRRPGARRLFARVLEVVEPSPFRRDPLCEKAAICRGCQLRHLTVAEELSFKVRAVGEVMEKFTGLSTEQLPPIEVITHQPISRGDGFRIRTSLSYRRRGESFELGLHSAAHSELIAMNSCPALTGPAQRLVQTVESTLGDLEGLPWDGTMARDVSEKVDLIQTDLGLDGIRAIAPMHGQGLVELRLTSCEDEEHFIANLRRPPFSTLLEGLVAGLPEQVGLAVSSGEFRRHVKEPRRLIVPVDRWRLEVGYDDWFHATLEPAEALYEALFGLLELDVEERFLDVGCGIGTIAVMASKRVKEVVGIDINRHSIEAAEINALGNEAENVTFHVGAWERGMRRLAGTGNRFEVATINPMREPLGRRPLAYLGPLGVNRLVYLGPSPASAAKDIAVLLETGWRLDYLGAANLHPATYHTMLVARLHKP
ncbi:MAG: class I SAM-dependent RNA methyltransferase [Bradymonadaceae bacterium]